MIPVKYLDELKTAPVDEVDFVATFIEVTFFDISCGVSLVLTNPQCVDVRGQIHHHG